MSTLVTHAVILAAGRGSRLGTMTDDAPKCLVHVSGRPLLDWMTEALEHAGITSTLVVTGYASDALTGYASKSMTLRHHARWSHTNMVGSLMVAEDWLERHSCLIVYSDIAVRSAWLVRLAASTENIVVANNIAWQSLWSERFTNILEDAETFRARNGLLLEIGKKAHSLEQIEGQFMGLLKTTPNGWAKIKAALPENSGADTIDTTHLLSCAIAKGAEISVLDCDGGWIEIDSKHDRDVVENGAETVGWAHDWRD